MAKKKGTGNLIEEKAKLIKELEGSEVKIVKLENLAKAFKNKLGSPRLNDEEVEVLTKNIKENAKESNALYLTREKIVKAIDKLDSGIKDNAELYIVDHLTKIAVHEDEVKMFLDNFNESVIEKIEIYNDFIQKRHELNRELGDVIRATGVKNQNNLVDTMQKKVSFTKRSKLDKGQESKVLYKMSVIKKTFGIK